MKRTPPSLLDLPAELILLIVQHLDDAWELNSLCLTHSSLHRLLEASLYRHSVAHDDSFVLIYASLTGNISMFKKALGLAPNADVNAVINCCDPEYIAAAEHYHREDTVSSCCRARHDATFAATPEGSQVTWEEFTPLGCAVIHQHLDIVRLLVSHARIQIAFGFGEQSRPMRRAPCPVLHIAAHQGNVAILEALLQGLLANREQGVVDDPVEIRRALSSHYSNWDYVGVNGCPLYLAVLGGHADVAEMLLHGMKEHLGAEATAEVVRRVVLVEDNWGIPESEVRNALMQGLLAVKSGVFERLVCLLVEFGGVNSLGDMSTDLAMTGNVARLRFLVERGFMPKIKSISREIIGIGNTACKEQSPQGKAILLPLLHAAVANGHVETVRYLLDLGADPTARAGPLPTDEHRRRVDEGFTAFHVAMTGPDATLAAIVRLLIEPRGGRRQQFGRKSQEVDGEHDNDNDDYYNSLGPSISWRALSPKGLTPLMLLALRGQHTKGDAYVPYHRRHRQSDRSTSTKIKKTPNCAAALHMLASHGADITAKSLPSTDSPPRSVLYLTAARGCYFCVRVVLQILGYERTIAAMQREWHPIPRWSGLQYLPGECASKSPDRMLSVVVMPREGGEHVAHWRNQLGTALWDEFGERTEEIELRRRAVDEFRESWDEGRVVLDDTKKEKKNGRAKRRRRRRERIEARPEDVTRVHDRLETCR